MSCQRKVCVAHRRGHCRRCSRGALPPSPAPQRSHAPCVGAAARHKQPLISLARVQRAADEWQQHRRRQRYAHGIGSAATSCSASPPQLSTSFGERPGVLGGSVAEGISATRRRLRRHRVRRMPPLGCRAARPCTTACLSEDLQASAATPPSRARSLERGLGAADPPARSSAPGAAKPRGRSRPGSWRARARPTCRQMRLIAWPKSVVVTFYFDVLI